MNHGHKGRKFGRKQGDRHLFLEALLNNFIMHERITTTDARAQEIRPMAEKLITVARKNDLAALRLLLQRLPKQAAMKLYYEIAPRFKDRKGGYTRITKTATVRMRDAAGQSVIEFVA